MQQEDKNMRSSLGAASQLKARKAAIQAKDGVSSTPSKETLTHKPIDLQNEEWQKPKASGVVAAVATSVAGIALVVVVAVVLGGAL